MCVYVDAFDVHAAIESIVQQTVVLFVHLNQNELFT